MIAQSCSDYKEETLVGPTLVKPGSMSCLPDKLKFSELMVKLMVVPR